MQFYLVTYILRIDIPISKIQLSILTFLDTQAIEVDIAPIYTLHPDWPNCKVSEETFNEIVDKLKIYLEKRIQSREKLQTDVREKGKCYCFDNETFKLNNIP